MRKFQYTSLFLLVVFTVLAIGCQTFLPDYDNVKTLQNTNDNESNRISFFDSAKRLFSPDFDNQNDAVETKIVAEKNTERYKQTVQTPVSNRGYGQPYAYGNSLSVNRSQTFPSASYPFQPNVNTNFLASQNNFVTKNTHQINSNLIQNPIVNSIDSSNGLEQVVVKNEKVEIKNEKITSSDLISSNVVDSKSNSNSKSDSGSGSDSKTDSIKSELKLSQLKSFKKYEVDPLLPQDGDSEYFRLFLKELATIPPDKLKVDETELAERIDNFRNEKAMAKNPAFETIALGNLRADILPDFLANKKFKKNYKNNSADSDSDSDSNADSKLDSDSNSDSEMKSVLVSNKKIGGRAAGKSKIEQVSYSEGQESELENIYCNDNSDVKLKLKTKAKIDEKNAPLPVELQASRGRKNKLSSISLVGVGDGVSRNLSSDSDLISSSVQLDNRLPQIPQLPNSRFANSQPVNSQQLNSQPVNLSSELDLRNEFQFRDQVDGVNFSDKFVSYPVVQSNNIVTANYLPSNYGGGQNSYLADDRLSNLGRSENNWELQVRRAIALLRREMETSYESRIFSNEVKLRLLELSVGNRNEAIKPFNAAEKQISEFWTDQILGLTTIMDDVVIPSRVARYDSALARFESGVTALRQVCTLRLKNAQLVHDDKVHNISFGSFQKLTDDCQPGETIVVYVELENPTIKNSADGYFVRVNVGYEILDAALNVVQKIGMMEATDIAPVQKRDHFIKMFVHLKKNLPNGIYKLRIRVNDLNGQDSQKIAEEQISFKIVAK